MRNTTTRTTRSTRPAARLGALGAAATLSLLLTACGGDDAGSMDHSSMGSESSSSSPSASASNGAAVDAEHDDQDVEFAQMMIVHHRGAIEMAQMAATRASSQEVQDLAATIEAAQQPEIEQMTSWLDAWGEPVEAHSGMPGMDHSGMPGMMTEEQTGQLQDATGDEFDRLFLQMMIEHHTGAVQMAETELQEGSNPQARELAGSIVESQSAEIEQMEELLAGAS
ncbi:DUF305 domain-containing protein [Kineococcus terrestris]|uniref:DUF305 domain-containing protein n=1 Tax=Kineococcus terrestris TaxID=2044856 RepID=UPI0034DB2396